MKNSFLILLILLGILKADILIEYKNRNYLKICNFENITKTKDEKLLSLVGISCVKTDNLYLLPLIFNKLKHTNIGRKNSIYFLTIYMQKKLLYSFVFDNFSLKGFNLPDTDYILSHIFVKIKNNNYKRKGNMIIINYKDEVIYIYPVEDKMIIDEYKNNKLIKRRWFR